MFHTKSLSSSLVTLARSFACPTHMVTVLSWKFITEKSYDCSTFIRIAFPCKVGLHVSKF